MRRRLPSDSELQEFLKLVRRTKEPAARRYLLRALQSFREGHLEAAVIMAWAGVERYCHLVAEDIGTWFFEEHFRKKGWKIPEPWGVSDYERISGKTTVFTRLTNEVDQLRKQRNKVAHGTGEFFTTSSDVLSAVVSVRPVLQRSRADEKFSSPLDVAKDLKEMDMPEDRVSNFIDHFPKDTRWQEIFDELIPVYLTYPKARAATLKNFLSKVYALRSSSSQSELWLAYIDQATRFLNSSAYNLRSKEEICSLLLPLPKYVERSLMPTQLKQLYEYLTEWLEGEVDYMWKQRIQSSSEPDPTILRWALKFVENHIPNETYQSIYKRWKELL